MSYKIESYTREELELFPNDEYGYVKQRVWSTGQITSLEYFDRNFVKIYLIRDENLKIIAFSCEKIPRYEGFDFEWGYSYVEPTYRGTRCYFKLCKYKRDEARQQGLIGYTICLKSQPATVKCGKILCDIKIDNPLHLGETESSFDNENLEFWGMML
jgi:hypothetical protein|tara:strand:+ start:2842 stop:3312 length:471 start_codon:yes stop_codon:yes gene_type:complete